MPKSDEIYTASGKQPELTGGENHPLGVYKPGFQFREDAMDFFRLCVGNETYERAMNSEVGKQHHYVVVRAFLNQTDWEKFVWIEEHGSLVDFPK